MTSPGEVWDAGLQPERTGLAWERTALAFLGLGLAVPRLAWPVLGPWAIAPAAVILAGALALFVAGHRRYRHTHGALTGAGQLRDGRLPLLATLVALVLALVAVLLVVVASRGVAQP